MKQRGFTLIEMMIGVVFLMILGMLVMGVVNSGVSAMSGGSNITWGVNGMTESRCIEGYKFVVGQDGHTKQILDEFGKGVRCENPNLGKPGAFGRM